LAGLGFLFDPSPGAVRREAAFDSDLRRNRVAVVDQAFAVEEGIQAADPDVVEEVDVFRPPQSAAFEEAGFAAV
jgi:hypothetical protein